MTAAAVRYRHELRPHRNTPMLPRGAPPRSEPTLIGEAKRKKRRQREPGLVEREFDAWLATSKAGEEFIYHRGELMADRLHDADLAALADRLQHLSTGRWDIVTGCGHVRGEVQGAGQVALLTRRIHGETRYLARKR